jgi:hypothetical protein
LVEVHVNNQLVLEVERATSIAPGIRSPDKLRDCIDVVLTRPSDAVGYGFGLGEGQQGTKVITNVGGEGCPAAGKLKQGDLILEVNGELATSLTHKSIIAILVQGAVLVFVVDRTLLLNPSLLYRIHPTTAAGLEVSTCAIQRHILWGGESTTLLTVAHHYYGITTLEGTTVTLGVSTRGQHHRRPAAGSEPAQVQGQVQGAADLHAEIDGTGVRRRVGDGGGGRGDGGHTEIDGTGVRRHTPLPTSTLSQPPAPPAFDLPTVPSLPGTACTIGERAEQLVRCSFLSGS